MNIFNKEMVITDEQLEVIGRLADEADNLVAASRLPVSPQIHAEGMRSGLIKIQAALAKLYEELAGDI
jgi:hypothetical protein